MLGSAFLAIRALITSISPLTHAWCSGVSPNPLHNASHSRVNVQRKHVAQQLPRCLPLYRSALLHPPVHCVRVCIGIQQHFSNVLIAALACDVQHSVISPAEQRVHVDADDTKITCNWRVKGIWAAIAWNVRISIAYIKSFLTHAGSAAIIAWISDGSPLSVIWYKSISSAIATKLERHTPQRAAPFLQYQIRGTFHCPITTAALHPPPRRTWVKQTQEPRVFWNRMSVEVYQQNAP